MFYGLTTDEQRRKLNTAISLLKDIYPRIFSGDHLITVERCMSFLDDDKFMQAYDRHACTEQEKTLIWRLHTLAWAAQHASHLTGDFVECGVYQGFCSAVLIDYLDFGVTQAQRRYYLYDTFSGIPEGYRDSTRTESPEISEPDLADKVRRRFLAWPNVHVVQGIVPEVFNNDPLPDHIAFLHLDMNSAKAEIGALDWLFDRVVPGGVIVFDDYGWWAYRHQQQQEHAFMARRGYTILELPTGQGLVVKRDVIQRDRPSPA